MEQINLIWQTPAGDATTFEFEYITEVVLNKFNQNRIFDNGAYETILDNSIIIYSCNDRRVSSNFLNYLNKFLEKGYNFYLLQLSNENAGHNCSYYEKAKYVIRNYYYDEINNLNVIYIPLGFKSGCLNKNNELKNEKIFDLSFVGQLKSDRYDLCDKIKDLNSFIYLTKKWNCETSLTQKELSEIYQKTKFVPCPMGNCHFDSFRLCESLEWGSVPIVKNYNNKDYFQNIFPNHPFPVVSSWGKMKLLLDEYRDEKYENLRKKSLEYYKEYKEKMSNKIYDIITNKN